MDSRTAKAVDRMMVKVEKEIERLKLVMKDLRTSIQAHYPAKKKATKETQ